MTCACLSIYLSMPGLQNGLLLQEPHRPREAPDEERRGDPRHRVGRVSGGQRAGVAKPLQVHDAEAAEGADPVAHLAQQLPEGQRARALPQRGRQPQDQNDGARDFFCLCAGLPSCDHIWKIVDLDLALTVCFVSSVDEVFTAGHQHRHADQD